MESRSLYWSHTLVLQLSLFVSVHRCVHAQSGTTIILPLGQGLRDMKTSFSMMVVGFILALFTMGLFWIFYRQCYNLLLAATSAVAATRGNTAPTAALSTAASRRRQEAIDQCPLLLFVAAKGPDFATSSVDCAVCLGELEDRDKVRFLPRCQHVFHPDCIDRWLRLRLTCPVCRTRLIAAEPGTSSPPPQPEDPVVAGDVEGGSPPTEEASGHSLVMAREDETVGDQIGENDSDDDDDDEEASSSNIPPV